MTPETIKSAIRNVPDFPVAGVQFKDIMPLLNDPELFRGVIDLFVERYKGKGIDKIAAVESRGFLLAAPLAYELGIGLAPIRKKGKLPYETIEESYSLEYGSATLAIHVDAIGKGEKVLLLDDLLATGGTALAAAHLIEKLGGSVHEIAFLIELDEFPWQEKLAGYEVFAPIQC